MLAGNHCQREQIQSQGFGRLCVITLKGNVQVYRVKDVQALDSCVLEWSAPLIEPLRLRNTMPLEPGSRVYVDKGVVCDNGTVVVFFTDQSRYEYSNETRLWREIS